MPNGIVRNSDFSKWEGIVELAQNIEDYEDRMSPDLNASLSLVHNYDAPKQQPFLAEVIAYRNHYRNQQHPRIAVVMTHPTYYYISAPEELSEFCDSVSHIAYTQNLFQLMEWRRNNPGKLSLVFAETPEAFAAQSSLWLSEGVIDDVVFTKYNQGYLLDGEECTLSGYQAVYHGGIKGNGCCKETLDCLRKIYPAENVLFLLFDLVMPENSRLRDTLENAHEQKISYDNIITIRAFLESL